jgi:serine/threonine protein kinase
MQNDLKQIGKYRIEGTIGQGAMGCVFKAWHPGFNAYVALKTIQDTRLKRPDLLERFKAEGQALAKLKHQGIVQIYDADQWTGVHFIVMEYMNAGSLERVISLRADIPLAKRVGYMIPVCRALEYAHKKRLFHRDIKPANIMLHADDDEEIVKLVDFGIAKLLDFPQISQTETQPGSPAYMAPELHTASSKANEKTDIWALGVTLYELIAYRRPFEANSLEELKRVIVYERPKSLTQIVSDCPDDLAAVVEKALQKEPAARYQTVGDVLVDLEPIVKKLLTDAAANLVRRAKELIEVGELESAKSKLEEARKYEASNVQVRGLLREVQEQISRKDLLPRLQEQVKLGRQYLAAGQLNEAKFFAQNAIGLDSRYEPAHKLLEEIQEAEALAEKINQKLDHARRCIAEDELTEAGRLVNDVLSLDPENREAEDLSSKILSQRQGVERRKRLHRLLATADDLLIQGKYEECLAFLEELSADFGENAEIVKRRDTALAEKAEQRRLALIGKAKKLRASQHLDQALSVLEELLSQFPDDVASLALRASITKEIDQNKLNAELSKNWEDLLSLRLEGRLVDALAFARTLASEFPAIEKIGKFILEVETELDRSKRATAIKQVQSLIASGSFSQAIQKAEVAAREFPDDSTLRSLREEAESGERQENIRRVHSEVQNLLQEERHASALLALKQALRSYPDDPTLLALQNRVHNEAHRLHQRRLGEALLALDRTEYARARELLNSVDWASAEPSDLGARAKSVLEEVRLQENIHNVLSRARSLISQDKYDDAVKLLTQAQRETKETTLEHPNARKGLAEIDALLNTALERQEASLRRQREIIATALKMLESDQPAKALELFDTAPTIYFKDTTFQRVYFQCKRALEQANCVQTTTDKVEKCLAREDISGAQSVLDEALKRFPEEPGLLAVQNNLRSWFRLWRGQRVKLLDDAENALGALDYARAITLLTSVSWESADLSDLASQAKSLLDDAHRRKSENRISQSDLRKDRPAGFHAPKFKLVSESPFRWQLGLLSAVLAFALVAAVVYFGRRNRLSHPSELTKQEIQLKFESTELRKIRKFNDAIEKDRELEKIGGAMSGWAKTDLNEIQDLLNREELLMYDAKSAENKHEWELAINKYQDVVNLHAAEENEANSAIERVKLAISGASATQIADEQLRRGVDAYKRSDYQLAEKILQSTLSNAPPNWANQTEARNYIAKSQHRRQQYDLTSTADRQFRSKDYDHAKETVTLAAQMADGDTDANKAAQILLQMIQFRMDQLRLFEEAKGQAAADPKGAQLKFERVAQFPEGDPDIVKSATEEIAKLKQVSLAASPPTLPKPASGSYKELIWTIDSLLKQGNWATAEEQLGRLPNTDPDYRRLSKSIDNVMAFDENKAAAEKALKNTNQPGVQNTLQNLLQYFERVSGSRNEHARDAASYVRRIEETLMADARASPKPPPTVPAGVPSISAEDQRGIEETLIRFTNGVNRRSMKDIKAAWPEIPKSELDEYERLTTLFIKFTISLLPQKWEPEGTGYKVTCQRTVAYEKDGKPVFQSTSIDAHMLNTK